MTFTGAFEFRDCTRVRAAWCDARGAVEDWEASGTVATVPPQSIAAPRFLKLDVKKGKVTSTLRS